jgi:hypothetical protein
MKIIKLITVFIILASFNRKDKMEEYLVINSIGDTSFLFRNDTKEVFYVFILEPSCTGCKDNLAKILIKKKNLVIVTNYLPYIEDRKISQKYYSGVFPNVKEIYFLPSKNQQLNIQNLNSKKMPCMIWYSSKTKLYSLFSYDDIFENTAIRKSFKNELKEN